MTSKDSLLWHCARCDCSAEMERRIMSLNFNYFTKAAPTMCTDAHDQAYCRLFLNKSLKQRCRLHPDKLTCQPLVSHSAPVNSWAAIRQLQLASAKNARKFRVLKGQGPAAIGAVSTLKSNRDQCLEQPAYASYADKQRAQPR